MVNQISRSTRIFDADACSHGACHRRHTLDDDALVQLFAGVLRWQWLHAQAVCPTHHGQAKYLCRLSSNRSPRLAYRSSPRFDLCIEDISCVYIQVKLRNSAPRKADVLLAAATEAKQGQQTGEQIENRDKQADGSHHVIALATIHNLAGLKQNQTGRQQCHHR